MDNRPKGLLGIIKSKIKDDLQEKIDIKEKTELINEFENWSNGNNPLMRKMSLMQMATNMNENEIKNLREMFIKIDED